MMQNDLPPKVFACSQSEVLAKKIANEYGVEMGNVNLQKFSDGEFQPAFEESVRGTKSFYCGLYHASLRQFNGIITHA